MQFIAGKSNAMPPVPSQPSQPSMDTEVEATKESEATKEFSDHEPTRVDAPRARRDSLDPGSADSAIDAGSQPILISRRPSATSVDRATSLSITTLRDTLQWQDAERTRGFVALAGVVCCAVSLTLFFVGGDRTAKLVFGAMMGITTAVSAWLYLRLRDPLNYDLTFLLRLGYVHILAAFSGIHFFGYFSPAAAVIPFGLYFFGLAHSFRGTLLIYAVCSVAYAALAVPIGLGWLPDRGLIQADLTAVETVMVVGAVEVIFFVTYAIARLSRKATENALHEHDKAVRAVAGRDALLHEARMDLEGVLRARGLGRFTDETVGSFRLGEILGRGGMGEVYEGWHMDSEEPVAVKLLHPTVLGDEDAVRRFMRECKLASTLDVPNVVRVFETSAPDDPIPYIAMERLRGADLSDSLRSRPRMRMRDVLRLIREVGRGLDAARKADIVHRDIKPRNLFLAESEDGQKAEWKILDFGVSKLGTEATLTQQHIVGTPSYMAPEQAEGEEVTHRTDLYSLGVIAYRALTGRPAFSADSPAAILYQVVNGHAAAGPAILSRA